MPSADALRTLVVVGGQAGGQFLRAMRYGQCAERFDVVALVDIDPGRLAETGGSHTACTDLDQALRREAPHVVVCVNEEFHSGVLDAVPEQAPRP
jgi:predicted dehydrogenase